MGGKTATGIRKNLEAFKEAAQAGVSGSPIRRAQDVALLKAHLDGALTLLDKHIGHHTKGEKAMVDLKAQLTTYKALLDRIGTDGPAPGTKPSYMDMLKTRAFGMPDSALAQIDTHGRQGVKDLGHLGSGAVNSTRLVHYQGEAAPMVFKPMHAVSNGASGMEALAGIDLNDPRFANRNVATSLAANHLGLGHMVPRTQYAAVGDQVGIAMEKLGGFGVGARDPQRIPLSDADKRYVEQAEAGLSSGKRTGSSISQELPLRPEHPEHHHQGGWHLRQGGLCRAQAGYGSSSFPGAGERRRVAARADGRDGSQCRQYARRAATRANWNGEPAAQAVRLRLLVRLCRSRPNRHPQR